MHCLEVIKKRNGESTIFQTNSGHFEQTPNGIFWISGQEVSERAKNKGSAEIPLEAA